ncbi:MAG: hypothetical protein GY839_07480 [candidate division Zixibacteria bacterium]|nr:hypothetical protein [candidate division Zixibacteria bacterium]
MNVIEKLCLDGSDKEKIAEEVTGSPEYITQLLDGLSHDKGRVRLGCDKVLRLISERQPTLIYGHFDIFVMMLDSDNNILKWSAIITISNLVSVDTDGKFEKIFKKYYLPIAGKTMITASNIIKNSWKIALAKPALIEKITQEILKAEKAKYINKGQLSPECNNIVCGNAIDSFDKFYDKIKNKKPVTGFVKRQLKNTRKPVVKRAEKFLKKHKIGL